MSTLTTEQIALATDPDNINMAEHIAKHECLKRGLPHLVDDATGEAMVGLMQAVRSYDPDRGTQFSTHAIHRIRGAVLDFFRSEQIGGYRQRSGKKHKHIPKVKSIDGMKSAMSAAPEYDVNESRPFLWQEIDPHSATSIELIEWHDDLDRLARMSGGRSEAELLRLYYGGGAGASMKAVGKAMGLSESRISQIHSIAIANLRQQFSAIDGGREIA